MNSVRLIGLMWSALIAAGQSSGRLRIFEIEEGGSLQTLKNVDVGKQPWWVMTLPVKDDGN